LNVIRTSVGRGWGFTCVIKEKGGSEMDNWFNEAEVIHSYTRQQAIADGVLVDVSEMAEEAGFLIPVAITAAINAEVVTPSNEAIEALGQSYPGRLWDVLWMLHLAIHEATSRDDPRQLNFMVMVSEIDGMREVELKAVCAPNDDASPCITIMFPYED